MAMKIGELADRARTSVKTIRYYDDVGVLRVQERARRGIASTGRMRWIATASSGQRGRWDSGWERSECSSLSAIRIKRRANSSPG
jgi:hypothetical protein